MILFDTDHLSVFMDERDSRHELLNERVEPRPIAMVNDALLVTGDVRDFVLVLPELRCNNSITYLVHERLTDE